LSAATGLQALIAGELAAIGLWPPSGASSQSPAAGGLALVAGRRPSAIKSQPFVANCRGGGRRALLVGRWLLVASGKAIEVEGGSGERLPSVDIRRPRYQDSDVVIQIPVEYSDKDAKTSTISHGGHRNEEAVDCDKRKQPESRGTILREHVEKVQNPPDLEGIDNEKPDAQVFGTTFASAVDSPAKRSSLDSVAASDMSVGSSCDTSHHKRVNDGPDSQGPNLYLEEQRSQSEAELCDVVEDDTESTDLENKGKHSSDSLRRNENGRRVPRKKGFVAKEQNYRWHREAVDGYLSGYEGKPLEKSGDIPYKKKKIRDDKMEGFNHVDEISQRKGNPVMHDHDDSGLEEGQLVELEDDDAATKAKKGDTEETVLISSTGVRHGHNEKKKQVKQTSCNKEPIEYDKSHILETLAKMEKRRERFKEPIAPQKAHGNAQNNLSQVKVEKCHKFRQKDEGIEYCFITQAAFL
ncbi:hypothetical protein Taro_038728, partial [Colocasia esculenta]|nr:hypothetical protein [Colocasia esculenta]